MLKKGSQLLDSTSKTTKTLTKKSLADLKSMKNGHSSYFQSKDWLAQPINFFYQGSTTQGTLLGGCLSCCASVFFFMFVCVQLYAWAFEPDYNEQYMFHYIDSDATEMYEIPTQKFLPTVAICDDYY